MISSDITRKGVTMSDLLIRDVPEEVLAALDKHAVRLGLSRSEYIRRRLAQDAHTAAVTVTTADWRRFTDDFADLGDVEVIGQAWE
jgi:ribbon-helix-helix CopG family protein